jgi:hypothetical protein
MKNKIENNPHLALDPVTKAALANLQVSIINNIGISR